MGMSEQHEGPRSFSVFMHELSEGEAHGEASQKLHELVNKMQDAALDQGKEVKGEFTLSLKLKVDPRGTASVDYTIKAKAPDRHRLRATLFVTKGGNLSVENPRQQTLPLREVAGQAAPAREVVK
jgi:hypothetical protein